MRTFSVLTAALVAASSVVASGETAKPKYYFPRHVKRQLSNGTTTSHESVAPSTSLDTTKRQSNSDSDSSSDSKVTTIVVPVTVIVSPPFPTPTSDSTSTESESASRSVSRSVSSSESSSDSSTSEPSDSTSTRDSSSSVSSSTRTPVRSTSTRDSSSEETSTTESSSEEASSTETAPGSTSTPDDSSASETSTPEPEQPSSTVVPPLPGNSTSSIADDEPTSTSSPAAPEETTSTSGILLAPTGIVTTSASSSEPGSPLSSLLSDIDSVISSIFDPSPNATAPATPTSTSVLGPTDGITGPGTGVSTTAAPSTVSEPTVTEPPVSDSTSVSEPGLPPVTNSTISSTESTITSPPPGSTSIPGTGTNSTTSISQPPESTPPTSLPGSVPGNSSVPTGNSTVPPVPSTTITLPTSEASTTTSDTTSRPPEAGVTSIPVITTSFEVTQPYIPSTILVDPISTTASGLIPTTASGIPTGLPSAIAPNNGPTKQPDDTTLIQIGFFEGYNYPFVVQEDRAAGQIFKYLPQALSEAAGFDISKAVVKRLQPMDTQNSLGYITTLAILSYPRSMVEALSSDIKIPTSALYHSKSQLIYNLTQQINPAIPIFLGQDYNGGNGGAGGNGGSGGGGSSSNDPFGGSGDSSGNQSGAQRGTTAGIVSGAVAVAAAYGVVMFVVARRYKRKKQSHRRASSISNPSEMSEAGRGSPALMGGALLSRDFTSSYGAMPAGGRDSQGSGRSGAGNSGRTQFISAPVAAGNSLGWN